VEAAGPSDWLGLARQGCSRVNDYRKLISKIWNAVDLLDDFANIVGPEVAHRLGLERFEKRTERDRSRLQHAVLPDMFPPRITVKLGSNVMSSDSKPRKFCSVRRSSFTVAA